MENKIVPQALIQVGPWVYPLMGPQTMILKNEMGIYVVPNPAPEHPSKFLIQNLSDVIY